MPLTLRLTKGARLSYAEMDGNFTFLQNSIPDSAGIQNVINTAYIQAHQDYAYSSLTGAPVLATVATSGAYSDLSGSPALATVATSGLYSDLSGNPALAAVATSGSYTDLSNTPTLATVATSGAYSDLSGAPALFSGAYGDLTGTPTYATVATSGAYSDLSGKPNLATVATTGDYTDLAGIPILATVATSGDYNDLLNIPAAASGGLDSANVSAIITNDVNDAYVQSRAGKIPLDIYTVATLPASGNEGELIYVQDGDAGFSCLAVRDNTGAYLRIPFGAEVLDSGGGF